MHDKELGKILIDLGVIDDKQLVLAAEYQQRNPGVKLGQALDALHFVDEVQVAKVLCRHFKLPYVDLSTATLERDVVALAPASVVRDFGIIPVRLHGDVLLMATDDPFVTSSVAAISAIVGRRVAFALTASTGLDRLRGEHY